MGFHYELVNMMNYIDYFAMLNQSCIPGVRLLGYDALSFLYIAGFDLSTLALALLSVLMAVTGLSSCNVFGFDIKATLMGVVGKFLSF